MNSLNIDPRNPIDRLPVLPTFILIAVALACFALSAHAVTPAPDGGYPGSNTAEGEDALFSLTTGGNNTAIGFEALNSNTSGIENTATGWNALVSNQNGLLQHGHRWWRALWQRSSGKRNTATGVAALSSNNADDNTATGFWRALCQHQRHRQHGRWF